MLCLEDLALDLPSLPRNLGIGCDGTTTLDGRHFVEIHLTSDRSSAAVGLADKVSGTAVDCVEETVAAVAILMWAHMVAKMSVYGRNAADQMTVQHIIRADTALTFTAVGKERMQKILASNRGKEAKARAKQLDMELLQWLQANCWVSREKLTVAVMKEALRAMKATRCYPSLLISGNQEVLKDRLLKMKAAMAHPIAVRDDNEEEGDGFDAYESASDPDPPAC